MKPHQLQILTLQDRKKVVSRLHNMVEIIQNGG
jgi:hypothetical protein